MRMTEFQIGGVKDTFDNEKTKKRTQVKSGSAKDINLFGEYKKGQGPLKPNDKMPSIFDNIPQYQSKNPIKQSQTKPVKIPYISREPDLLKPDKRSLLGINRTSMPARTVSRTLFRVRGTDMGKSFFKVLKNFLNSRPAFGDWQKKVYLSR